MEKVEEAYRELVDKNNPSGAIEILKNLNKEVVLKNPLALMVLTHAHRLIGHLNEAEFYARKLMEYDEWASHVFWAYGFIQSRRGKLDEALKNLEKAKVGLKKTRYLPSVLLDIGGVYWFKGELEKAKSILIKALEVAKERGNFALVSAIFGNLSVITWSMGRFQDSLEYAQKSLSLAHRYGWKNSLCHMLANLIINTGKLGDLKSCRDYFNQAIEEQCDKIPDVNVHLHIALTFAFLIGGNLNESLHTLLEIKDEVAGLENRELAANYYMALANVYYKLHNYKKALQAVEKSLKMWGIEKTSVYTAAKLFKKLILARLNTNFSITDFSPNIYKEWEMFSPILIGLFYNNGLREKALNMCIDMARKHGRTIGDIMIFWDEMKSAIKDCIERFHGDPDFLKFMLHARKPDIYKMISEFVSPEHYINILKYEEFPPEVFNYLAPRITPNLRGSYFELRSTYIQSSPLKIYTFGKFELWIGNFQIPEEAWERPMALKVLKFFITNRNKWLKRDYILENLWPGEAPESSSSRLRVYLNYIRKIMEPWKLKNEKSDFIKWKGGAYGFFPGESAYIDVDRFEKLIHSGLANLTMRKSALDELAKALYLYRGPYMEEEKYQSWAEIERIRLRRLFVTGVRKYAELLVEIGQVELADFYLYKAFFEDPTDEELVFMYLRLLKSLNRIGEALKIYEIYRERLMRLYDLTPSEEIEYLHHELKVLRDNTC